MPRLRPPFTLAGIRSTLAAVAHAVLGVPDYERYLRHVRHRHPELVPLSRDAFARDRLADRYDRPGSRCC